MIEGGLDLVKTLLPHRDPFLFIDKILEVDAEEKTTLAERHVAADAPVFKGHFPNAPIFPASLQIEAIGQTCICAWSYIEKDRRYGDQNIVVAKVDRAVHYHPILPGDTMELHAKLIYFDDLCGTAAGQIYVGERLCSLLVVTVAMIDV
ncbi:MAG: beta-hydroxyacyl-ACP dehydratase [Alphaproteobacteria bacterium]|nr:beta-hydroxyacyl-ACP dehydratase [Alphaproteobacteria bacterium]